MGTADRWAPIMDLEVGTRVGTKVCSRQGNQRWIKR
jgi:hypothetical protein